MQKLQAKFLIVFSWKFWRWLSSVDFLLYDFLHISQVNIFEWFFIWDFKWSMLLKICLQIEHLKKMSKTFKKEKKNENIFKLLERFRIFVPIDVLINGQQTFEFHSATFYISFGFFVLTQIMALRSKECIEYFIALITRHVKRFTNILKHFLR